MMQAAVAGTLAAEVNARHSQDSPEWYTPAAFADAAREVFGGVITLDPASHPEANELVKAESFYTQGMNGLILPWRGSVFVNPPGGDDDKGKPLVPQFWRKLWREMFGVGAGEGGVEQAIWIGYSIEQLQTLQGVPVDDDDSPFVQGVPSPLKLASAICIPRRRIAFVENAAKREQRIAKLVAAGKTPNKKSSPSHANYIAYLGPNERAFRGVFQQFGDCR